MSWTHKLRFRESHKPMSAWVRHSFHLRRLYQLALIRSPQRAGIVPRTASAAFAGEDFAVAVSATPPVKESMSLVQPG